MLERHDITNIDVALFSLFRLGGATKKVHTEYIAWEAFQLAPERFSWRLPEFREKGFPDKTPVRHALEQAKKREYGSLVKGRAGGDAGGEESEGWIFTPAGVEWIKNNESRITRALEYKPPLIHPREVDRFLRKIRKDKSFEYFESDRDLGRVSPYMFTDMLGCTPDAPSEIVSKKFDRLLSTAISIGDKNTIEFLEKCRRKFSSLMGEENPEGEAKNESR